MPFYVYPKKNDYGYQIHIYGSCIKKSDFIMKNS